MERGTTLTPKLYAEHELEGSLEHLSEDFVQLDAQIHGIAYPDYDLITAQIQTRLRVLRAWFPIKGSILILLYEEILATLEQVAAYRKDFNNNKIND